MGISKIRSLYKATESSFDTDPSADGSGYRFVHAGEFSVAPDPGEPLERVIQDDTFDHAGIIIGAQGGSLGYKTELRGPGSSAEAGSGVTASHGEEGLSLKALFGSVNLGVGTAFAAGWTTTSGDVTSAAGIAVGDIIYQILTSGRLEARPVTAKSTNTLTVAPAWSEAPAEAAVCYAMANYRAASSGFETESAVIKGDGGLEWLFQGMAGDVTLELSARAVPKLAWNYLLNANDHTSAKGSLPATTDAYPSAPVVRRTPLYIDGNAVEASEITFNLGNDRQPKIATSGTQGRSGWAVVGQNRMLTAKVYYAESWLTNYQAEDTFPLFLFIAGSSVGNVAALYIPNAQIVNPPPLEEINGSDAQTLTIRALQPSSSSFAPVTFAIG